HRGQTRATNFLALRLPLLTAAVAKPRNFEFEFAGASFGFLCAATTLDNGALATADLPNWRLFVFVADRRLVVLLAILFVVLLFVIRTFVIGIVVGGFQLVVTLKLRIFAILFRVNAFIQLFNHATRHVFFLRWVTPDHAKE